MAACTQAVALAHVTLHTSSAGGLQGSENAQKTAQMAVQALRIRSVFGDSHGSRTGPISAALTEIPVT